MDDCGQTLGTLFGNIKAEHNFNRPNKSKLVNFNPKVDSKRFAKTEYEDDLAAPNLNTGEEFVYNATNEKVESSTDGIQFVSNNETSEVYKGDHTPSHYEQFKYFAEARMSTCGLDLKKKKLNEINIENETCIRNNESVAVTGRANSKGQLGLPERKIHQCKNNIYSEPVFGIRIISPVVSHQKISEKMMGKTAVSFLKIKDHVSHGDLKDDWVLGAVLVNKSPPKVSQKGSTYVIWTLSDLKKGLRTVALFLFRQAYEKLWKTSVGTVLGILNPNVFANKENCHEATLSITNPDQIMVWGRSKDLGTCKSKKKNGEDCGAFVNISECEFCIYHVQSEYKKFTGRSELQSPTCGSMNSTKLRNKVIGKNEIFYAGKSFVAIPIKKGSKERNNNRLNNLGTSTPRDSWASQSQLTVASSPISTRTSGMMKMLNKKERNDHNRLTSLESKIAPNDNSVKMALKKNDSTLKCHPRLTDPKLDSYVHQQLSTSKNEQQKQSSRFQLILQENFHPVNSKSEQHYSLSSKLDKSISKETKYFTNVSSKLVNSNGSRITKEETSTSLNKDENSVEQSKNIATNFYKPNKFKHSMSNAKLKALAYVKKKGKISKNDYQAEGRGVKRFLESEKVNHEDDVSHNVFSERFVELMKMETNHKNLVQLDEIIKEREYFDKMEKKEQMQEKMLTTYVLECKLVRCLQCKYTWFSASDACKAEHHSLKVFTGLKRFFKCTSCANRTVAVSFLPLLPCQKCGETKWERAAMIKENLVTNNEQLCIRGGEEKFINSVGTNMNLNLLVPD